MLCLTFQGKYTQFKSTGPYHPPPSSQITYLKMSYYLNNFVITWRGSEISGDMLYRVNRVKSYHFPISTLTKQKIVCAKAKYGKISPEPVDPDDRGPSSISEATEDKKER